MLNITSVKAGAHYMRPSTQSLQPDSLMMLSSAFDTRFTDLTSSAAAQLRPIELKRIQIWDP